MATRPTRLDVIRALVYAPLGSPVLPRELELDGTLDVIPALLKYYRYVPIKVGKAYTITNERELSVRWKTFMPDFQAGNDSAPYEGDYFHVGIIHHAIRHQLGVNSFNQQLLGLNVGIPITNPMENVGMATEIDISMGDVYYEEDGVNELTRFVVGGSGTLSVTWGVGHYDVEKVLLRHIEVVAALAAEIYLERIVAVRKTGNFNSADFKLDVSQLESFLEKAKEKAKAYLDEVGFLGMTIG
jgi:hypothetical protein